MKLLHITNFFPPYDVGPGERQCRLIVDELANRGHFNRVLTSSHVITGVPDRSRFALRQLKLQLNGNAAPRFSLLHRNERQNLAALREALDSVQIDAVIVWSMAGLSNSLLWEVERRGVTCIFAVLDQWPRRRMREDPWFSWWTGALRFRERAMRRTLRTLMMDRRILARFPIRRPTEIPLANAFFASKALRDSIRSAGYRVDGSSIIPYCIGREEVPAAPQRGEELRRILWIGQLNGEQDPMTAIQAIQELRHGGAMQFSLDIFGRGDLTFENRMHDYVRDGQLAGAVTIRPNGVEDMVSLFAAYDLFLFTPRHPDAFPLTLLRAMAARVPIVTTIEGACADVVHKGENATVFRAGDPTDCAAKILTLAHDRDTVDAMTERAYRQVIDDHSVLAVAGQVERLIAETVERSSYVPAAATGTSSPFNSSSLARS